MRVVQPLAPAIAGENTKDIEFSTAGIHGAD